MILDLDQLSPSQTYFQMIQTLIPRPIAWVLSEHANGSLNLAPFSSFTAVGAEPRSRALLCGFGVGLSWGVVDLELRDLFTPPLVECD